MIDVVTKTKTLPAAGEASNCCNLGSCIPCFVGGVAGIAGLATGAILIEFFERRRQKYSIEQLLGKNWQTNYVLKIKNENNSEWHDATKKEFKEFENNPDAYGSWYNYFSDNSKYKLEPSEIYMQQYMQQKQLNDYKLVKLNTAGDAISQLMKLTDSKQIRIDHIIALLDIIEKQESYDIKVIKKMLEIAEKYYESDGNNNKKILNYFSLNGNENDKIEEKEGDVNNNFLKSESSSNIENINEDSRIALPQNSLIINNIRDKQDDGKKQIFFDFIARFINKMPKDGLQKLFNDSGITKIQKQYILKILQKKGKNLTNLFDFKNDNQNDSYNNIINNNNDDNKKNGNKTYFDNKKINLKSNSSFNSKNNQINDKNINNIINTKSSLDNNSEEQNEKNNELFSTNNLNIKNKNKKDNMINDFNYGDKENNNNKINNIMTSSKRKKTNNNKINTDISNDFDDKKTESKNDGFSSSGKENNIINENNFIGIKTDKSSIIKKKTDNNNNNKYESGINNEIGSGNQLNSKNSNLLNKFKITDEKIDSQNKKNEIQVLSNDKKNKSDNISYNIKNTNIAEKTTSVIPGMTNNKNKSMSSLNKYTYTALHQKELVYHKKYNDVSKDNKIYKKKQDYKDENYDFLGRKPFVVPKVNSTYDYTKNKLLQNLHDTDQRSNISTIKSKYDNYSYRLSNNNNVTSKLDTTNMFNKKLSVNNVSKSKSISKSTSKITNKNALPIMSEYMDKYSRQGARNLSDGVYGATKKNDNIMTTSKLDTTNMFNKKLSANNDNKSKSTNKNVSRWATEYMDKYSRQGLKNQFEGAYGSGATKKNDNIMTTKYNRRNINSSSYTSSTYKRDFYDHKSVIQSINNGRSPIRRPGKDNQKV